MKQIFREKEGKGEKVEEYGDTEEWAFGVIQGTMKRKRAASFVSIRRGEAGDYILDKILFPRCLFIYADILFLFSYSVSHVISLYLLLFYFSFLFYFFTIFVHVVTISLMISTMASNNS